jgi:hypothetical protein
MIGFSATESIPAPPQEDDLSGSFAYFQHVT